MRVIKVKLSSLVQKQIILLLLLTCCVNCVLFSQTKLFFDTIQHVIDNYDFYRMMYQIIPKKLRNDFVFSIAIHIMNGFKSNDRWPKPMPARMFTTTDCDILHKIDGDRYTFFLDKESHPGQYTVNSVRGCNLHVMNKFSLGRCIDESEMMINE